jgi:hypothetical protein
MKSAFRFDVGGVCEFGGLECAEMALLAGYAQDGTPAMAARVLMNAKQLGPAFVGIRPAYVLTISLVRHIAQVVKSVVPTEAIFVVDFLRRPVSIRVKPSESMRAVISPVNLYDKKSSWFEGTGSGAYDTTTTGAKPCENPSPWGVVKKFAQALCGKIGNSHDAPRMLSGQRPTSVQRTVWALAL